MFTSKELNLRQRRWLDILKDYGMCIFYHPCKDDIVVDALNWLSIGRTAHVKEEKRDILKDVHRLACLGIRLMDFTKGGIVVTNKLESSIVSKV